MRNIMKNLTISISLAVLLLSNAVIANEECYESYPALESKEFEDVTEVTLRDLDKDGVDESIVKWGCGRIDCNITIIKLVKNCYSIILSAQGNVVYLDEIPSYVAKRSPRLDGIESKYPYIQIDSSTCSGYDQYRNIYSFNLKRQEYERFYSEEIKLCGLWNP
jgi:hypothetical protein